MWIVKTLLKSMKLKEISTFLSLLKDFGGEISMSDQYSKFAVIYSIFVVM